MLILINYGLRQLRAKGHDDNQPHISVVIAARNEEKRIQPCLESLELLKYPENKFEIILVDDCSEDDTAGSMDSYASRHAHWKVIRLTSKSTMLRGKKNALLKGISAAGGEIIFTTDADCRVPPGWLSSMSRMFKPSVSMVLGYSPLIERPGWIFKLLKFDNLFSAIASAAPTKLGYPFTSVGRNMAYRKEAYKNAGGFLALKKFKSGDDVHLTERFRYLNTGKIDFCGDPASFVETFPPDTLVEIFQQQIRKNSKILLSTPSSILMAVMIVIYYFLIATIPFFYSSAIGLWGILLLLKVLLELLPLQQANKIFNQKLPVFTILIFQIIYPFHIIFFSILGLFQVYKWKK